MNPKTEATPAQTGIPAVTVDTPEFLGRLTCCILAPDNEKDGEIAGLVAHIDAHTAQAVAAKQAEIDRLMLEFCPGEMSAEQMASWEASQRVVPGSAPQQHAQDPIGEHNAEAAQQKLVEHAQAALSDDVIRMFASASGQLEDHDSEWSFTDAALIAFAKNIVASQQPAAAPQRGIDRAAFTEKILLSVAEIPDRDSPEDQPEMMLVTSEELSGIIASAFETADEDTQAPAAAPAIQQEGAALDERKPAAWLHQLPPGAFFGDTEHSPTGQVLLTEAEAIMERESLGGTITPLFGALAAPVPVQPGSVSDATRLDLLERMANEPEGLLLHDGGDFTGRRGLGLRRIGRTLRQAVDAMTSQQAEKGGA